ncbi:uncharacterized protein TM35_000302260 [Trypanosoma theileri]|uniref:Uncharacterized protein n=1 Tax=Trypanosoma theileri TaxID=67003 RepID=A0A1X0NN90_9TRYP|nr:uncharacterized protein TM35_000302260 [Trypanosoma theileri]ORC86186.1 hypothetical protein TM35_000302260 [Trypanosoma theileri]
MSFEAGNVLCQLAEKADQIDRIEEIILILQQEFVKLFKMNNQLSDSSQPTTASFASTEEEKLLVVRAVYLLHRVGRERHKAFFQADSYHTSIAFFIHELLGSLSGDRKRWFQKLQIESLRACVAMIEATGCRNARLCLPGIVSACVKYIVRAQHGTDGVSVRIEAIELLRISLITSLASKPEDEQWLRETVGHLGRSMSHLLAPNFLINDSFTLSISEALLHLIMDVLLLPSLALFLETPLVRELLIGYFLLANQVILLGGNVWNVLNCMPQPFLQQQIVVEVLRTQLGQLRGLELLHFTTSLLRCGATLTEVFFEDDSFLRVLQRCIQVTGTEMSVEELYDSQTVRSRSCSVVDQFIESAAYTASQCPKGKRILVAFMDDCEATLENWDLYMIHPATIYVLTRLILWQFKTPLWVQQIGEKEQREEKNEKREKYERPVEEFVNSGMFEQLWSIVASPHLWNITEDEELCSYQQRHHRQVIAATILRFLELTAHLLRDGTGSHKGKRKRAFKRLNVLVLYLVLEKAAVAGIVHDNAMYTLEAFGEAGGYVDTLVFFLDQSGFIVDEAARAVEEESLRVSAASVLRGSIGLLQSRLVSGLHREGVSVITSRQWIDTIRNCRFTPIVANIIVIQKTSDFVASVIKVACDACRHATVEDDTASAHVSLLLLTDCFSISAALNRSVPQLGIDEEQERFTTAANPRVQILQLGVLEALQMLLAYCTKHDVVASIAIKAVIRALTVFLTTPKTELWLQEKTKDDDIPSSPPLFAWEDNTTAIIPQSHLRTVYKIYLSFIAILTEPIASFAFTSASRSRSAQERRALEDVRPTPAVITALGGLEALFALTTEFLSRRMVDEVLPLVATWYERGALPRIPTRTEEKLRDAVKRFLLGICEIDPSVKEEIYSSFTSLFPSVLPPPVITAPAAASTVDPVTPDVVTE